MEQAMNKFKLIILCFLILPLASCAVAIKEQELKAAADAESQSWVNSKYAYKTECKGPTSPKYSRAKNTKIASCYIDNVDVLVRPNVVYGDVFNEFLLASKSLIHKYETGKIDLTELKLEGDKNFIQYVRITDARRTAELNETKRRVDSVIEDLQRQEEQRQIINAINNASNAQTNYPTRAYCPRNSDYCQLR